MAAPAWVAAWAAAAAAWVATWEAAAAWVAASAAVTWVAAAAWVAASGAFEVRTPWAAREGDGHQDDKEGRQR